MPGDARHKAPSQRHLVISAAIGAMAMKLIGYERVSNQSQEIDRQIEDKLAAGVRRDDLCRDRGVSGAGTSRPGFDWPWFSLEEGVA
ncbi:recombinase family protein [Arthrobacter sp. NPDC093125]|uniref:recombinase family protein n=1 Tax=Arthrobacter sp. NPDC093125 TaxID=3363944 RepID=UPI0037FF5DEA